MTYNFEHLKIPTFSGVNDNPIEPTNAKASNGSYIIKQFNDLTDTVQDSLNSVRDSLSYFETNLEAIQQPSAVTTWITLNPAYDSQDFYLERMQNLFLHTSQPLINVHLPSQPQPGDHFTLVNTNGATNIYLQNYGKALGDYYQSLRLIDVHLPYFFLFTGNNSYGWYCLQAERIETQVYSS